MWIYEPSQKDEMLSIPERTETAGILPDKAAEETVSVQESQEPVRTVPSSGPPQRTRMPGTAARDCWSLAAAFLLGSASAGVLQAVCDARQAEILGYFLAAWRSLFAAKGLPDAIDLFGAQYLTLGIVVSLFFLLGFSALGPLLIFSCMMVYGLGSGLLLVQLSNAGGWQILLWTSIPAALAGGCLCLFGAAALQVSSRIRAYSFRYRSAGGQAAPGIRALLGQYLLTMMLLLPLCGVAAGLSCLGSRF